MKKKSLFVILQLLCLAALSQPYVDPLQIRYTLATRSSGQSRGTPFSHLWVGSDIPVELKTKTYLLLSPYYESWQIDSAKVKNSIPRVQGLVLPVGVLLPLKNPKWMLSLTGIVRSNGETLFGKNTFQGGGAGFLSYEKSPGKKWRFGVYVNSDFFGLFVMPLVGVDWKINDRNYMFGLLPGRFTFEHRFNKNLFGGFTFRAITSSFRLDNGLYARLDDNQLSAFLDIYPAKKLCLTLEPGYGIMRKLRSGIQEKKYLTEGKWGDGFFIKLSAAFRIRLDEKKTK